MKKFAAKCFTKMLKKLSFPHPIQHKFEIRKEVLNSTEAGNTESSTQKEEVHKADEAPKNKEPIDQEAPEEADRLLHETASPSQASCFGRIKLPSCLDRIRSTGAAEALKVLESFREKIFLLMCDKPLIRTEVRLNI